jgi:glycosyltransferase involved in cell wall biosynthesis
MTNTTLSQSDAEDREVLEPRMAEGLQSSRLKVLIGAYACSPARGSEYGVGWGWVEAISHYHDLWVLTAEHNKEQIEAEFERRPELRGRIQFHYIPRTRYLWAERIWPPAYLFTYRRQWLRDMYKVGRHLHSSIGFDVIHQLTYVGFRVPGHLWKLDAPFVWGPIGGLEQTTWKLLPGLGLGGCLYFTARNLLNDRDRRFSREAKLAFAKADGGIIAATSGIQREIKRFYHRESIVASEIGLPPMTREVPIRRLASEPLNLLWCGNLLAGKALPFLLEALKQLPPEVDWKLKILGSGPRLSAWTKTTHAAGIDHRCEWLGQLPRQSVLELMQQAHVLTISSVYDLTSTVVVEALANGLPVVCPNHCGFTDAITPDCGIRVPASSIRELVWGLRDAIVQMNDETFRFHLAKGALARSRDFDWDRKARIVSDLYAIKAVRSV